MARRGHTRRGVRVAAAQRSAWEDAQRYPMRLMPWAAVGAAVGVSGNHARNIHAAVIARIRAALLEDPEVVREIERLRFDPRKRYRRGGGEGA